MRSSRYAGQPQGGWKEARRTAFVQDVLGVLTRRPAHLLSFQQVSHKLHLGDVRYLDLQHIPLDQIAGSVNRYDDFTRAFCPRRDHLHDRWRRVENLVTAGRELPPIEVYKVGAVFFVRDGNHRVSVARQHGIRSIQAHVWEYESDVPLEPDCDVDELLCRTARAAFLARTGLDRLCPDLELELTQPDGYGELLQEMEAFQQALCRIDEVDVPFEEAVTLWREMRYAPIVDIIRRRHVLQEFPGRTEADLYLWLDRNQQELQVGYERGVLMEEAADDLATRFRRRPVSTRPLRRAAGWTAGAVGTWSAAWWRATRRALRRRRGVRGEE